MCTETASVGSVDVGYNGQTPPFEINLSYSQNKYKQSIRKWFLIVLYELVGNDDFLEVARNNYKKIQQLSQRNTRI